MDENNKPTIEKKQLCTLSIVFSTIGDDEALAVKKKITEALSDRPDIRVDFNIRQMPVRPMM